MKINFQLKYFIALCCISNIYGQNFNPIDPNIPKNIYQNLFHFCDSTGKVDIYTAIHHQQNGKFTPLKSKTERQEFGFNIFKRWYFFELSSREKAEMMLKIEYNNIDEIELYEVKQGIIQILAKTGDNFIFEQRPYPNNNYAFPITLEARNKAQYYLFINQPNSILSFNIELKSRDLFTKVDHREYLFWGIYIGIICIVLVVNLVMWLATRDKIYIWYSLYVHFMTMHLFADAGLAFQYLWPNTPIINSYHPVYLYIWLGLMAQVIFMQNFIHQTAQNSKMYRFLTLFRYIVFACFISIIITKLSRWQYGNVYLFKAIAFMSTIFVPIIFILTIISLYERRHEREVLVRYYGWAVLLQFVGYLFVAFVTYNQTINSSFSLPFDILSYIIIGSILLFDILFFSFGLSHRYKTSLNLNQSLSFEIINNTQASQQKTILALENERKRLAQDLHDDLGATISTAKGYISMMDRQKKSIYLAKTSQILDEVSNELRLISHLLMPKSFDKIGLANAIEESINKIQSEKLSFNFFSFGQKVKLNEQIELIIFRITTEMISIITNFSNAKKVTIQLLYHVDYLNITIEHDGVSDENLEKLIENINSKTEIIKGELIVESNENGFILVLKVPY